MFQEIKYLHCPKISTIPEANINILAQVNKRFCKEPSREVIKLL